MSSRLTPQAESVVTQKVLVSRSWLVGLLGITVVFLSIMGVLSEGVKLLDLESPTATWFYTLFDLDGEGNVPAFYSSFSLLLCAGLLRIIALSQTQHWYLRQWRFLSYLFLYLAADELLSIHEILIIPDLRDALGLPQNFDHIWVIPGAILVSLFVIRYRHFLRRLPSATSRLFVLAGAIYIGGALGIEFLSDIWTPFPQNDSLVWQLANGMYDVVLEEVLEMTGILVFIYALLSYLRRIQARFQLSFDF